VGRRDFTRPAPLSPEERERRKPPPPETLVGALQDCVHQEGKLIASKPIVCPPCTVCGGKGYVLRSDEEVAAHPGGRMRSCPGCSIVYQPPCPSCTALRAEVERVTKERDEATSAAEKAEYERAVVTVSWGQAQQERDAAVAVLRAVQWTGPCGVCVSCRVWPGRRCLPDCALAKVLAQGER
jgi:hypothetical protein